MNGTLTLPNRHIHLDDDDILYHFGFSKRTDDFRAQFDDVKFVCVGGSSNRIKRMAADLAFELHINDGSSEKNICNSDRFCMYKVGPILCVNHGIGCPSLSIMLVELFKLISYAECKNVIIFRIGTSGGIGLKKGTVVVSKGALNDELEPYHVQYILGERVKHPAIFRDQGLIQELVTLGRQQFQFPVETGITACTDDFYEGQGRLDGAFCDYNEEDKLKFMNKLHQLGVCNIEMEASCFAAMLNRIGLKGAIVCVTLVDRNESDKLIHNMKLAQEYETRPARLIIEYIKKHYLDDTA